jgi:hypothetical protein
MSLLALELAKGHALAGERTNKAARDHKASNPEKQGHDAFLSG